MLTTNTIKSSASTSIPAQPPQHPIALPFHSVPGVTNFRDIGGWPITPSSHVRTNLIFRGSDTTHITSSGIQALHALNVTTDFDLRNKNQVEKLGYKDLSEHGISRVWSPVFSSSETEEEVERRYELYASENVAVCLILPYCFRWVFNNNIGHCTSLRRNSNIRRTYDGYRAASTTVKQSAKSNLHALHYGK
jgi:hypothetical protein